MKKLFILSILSVSVSSFASEALHSNGACISPDGITYNGNQMIGMMKKGDTSIEVTPVFKNEADYSVKTDKYGMNLVSFGNTVEFYEAIHVDERSIWAGIKPGKKVAVAKEMACRFYNHD